MLFAFELIRIKGIEIHKVIEKIEWHNSILIVQYYLSL